MDWKQCSKIAAVLMLVIGSWVVVVKVGVAVWDMIDPTL